MNIQPVKSEALLAMFKPKVSATKTSSADASEDVFKPEQNEKLMQALTEETEVRPDMVARGRTLAADPSYPSDDVLKKIAGKLLADSHED